MSIDPEHRIRSLAGEDYHGDHPTSPARARIEWHANDEDIAEAVARVGGIDYAATLYAEELAEIRRYEAREEG